MEENNLKVDKIIKIFGGFAALAVVFSFYLGYFMSEMKVAVPFVSPVSPSTLGNTAQQPDRQLPYEEISPIKLRGDEVFEGPADSKLIAVTFTDFECPFCARFHPSLKEIAANNPEIKIVYKHFPLSFHANAKEFASNFECLAKLRGNQAATNYADSLFATALKDQGITVDSAKSLATSLGITENDLSNCKSDSNIKKKIDTDFAEGGQIGVNGTPATIFMNLENNKAVKFNGALDLATLQSELDKIK